MRLLSVLGKAPHVYKMKEVMIFAITVIMLVVLVRYLGIHCAEILHHLPLFMPVVHAMTFKEVSLQEYSQTPCSTSSGSSCSSCLFSVLSTTHCSRSLCYCSSIQCNALETRGFLSAAHQKLLNFGFSLHLSQTTEMLSAPDLIDLKHLRFCSL